MFHSEGFPGIPNLHGPQALVDGVKTLVKKG